MSAAACKAWPRGRMGADRGLALYTAAAEIAKATGYAGGQDE